jgi:hypothetical protein
MALHTLAQKSRVEGGGAQDTANWELQVRACLPGVGLGLTFKLAAPAHSRHSCT